MSDRIAEIIADHVVAKLIEGGYVVKGATQVANEAAPEKAAAKPAGNPNKPPKATTAPKAAPKTEAAPAGEDEGKTRADIHALLTTKMEKDGKDAALTVLHKYSDTLAGLKPEQFDAIKADLAGVEAEADPFGA